MKRDEYYEYGELYLSEIIVQRLMKSKSWLSVEVPVGEWWWSRLKETWIESWRNSMK